MKNGLKTVVGHFSIYFKLCLRFPETCDWSFIQLEFHKIKMEFQKIQLLFSKFEKTFQNFQLKCIEYSDTCI